MDQPVFCPNPHCTSRKSSFGSERGLQSHLQHSSSCRSWLDHSSSQDTATVLGSEKRRLSTSQLFQKKRLCFNPAAPAAQRLQLQKEEEEEEEEEEVTSECGGVFPIPGGSSPESPCSLPGGSPPVEGSFVCDDSEYNTFTVSQKSVVKLLHLLDKMEAPDYAFQTIMEWARDCHQQGFDFSPPCMTRKANITWMYSSIHNAKHMLPHLVSTPLPVPLPKMSHVDVICYDFVPQLLSLLQDQSLMTEDNLLLNPACPLAMYQPEDGRLGESLSGSMYRQLYTQLVTDPERQLLVPLAAYIDSTTVDTLSRFSVEPFTFSTLLFRYSRRCCADVWRPFGYVQDLNSKVTNTEHKLSPQAKVRNYHAQLSVMLDGLRKVQTGEDPRLHNVPICLFGEVKFVDVVCPIMFISADTPAADKLCGHYSNFAGVIERPTHACDVPVDDLDNPRHACNFVEWEHMNQISSSGTKSERKAVSQHKCTNAFADINIGDPNHKIFGSIPTDPMHSVRKSLIARSLDLVVQCMTDSEKNRLDMQARRFHESHRQTARRFYPRTDFRNGVTKLTLLTADENSGSLFLFACLAQFEEGWNLLDKALKSKGAVKSLQPVLEALEALCCFDAWTRLDAYWKIEEEEEQSNIAQESICNLMEMIKTCLPRADGCGWKLVTFHNITHIVSDMMKYGKSKEVNAEIGEKNHKHFAKGFGRVARKQHSSFSKQIAQRLSDAFVIFKMFSLMGLDAQDDAEGKDYDEESTTDIQENSKGATRYSVTFCHKHGVHVEWNSKTEDSLLAETDRQCLMEYVHYQYSSDFAVGTVHCCTEYKRDCLSIRCHPSYQGEGPWYDWVYVSFAEGECEDSKCPAGVYPCKVLAVVPCLINDWLKETELVVHPALKRNPAGDSVLFREWTMAKDYERVPISSVHSSPFVLEIGNGKISVAIPHEDWAGAFTDTTGYSDDDL